jgi:hypothetical protein
LHFLFISQLYKTPPVVIQLLGFITLISSIIHCFKNLLVYLLSLRLRVITPPIPAAATIKAIAQISIDELSLVSGLLDVAVDVAVAVGVAVAPAVGVGVGVDSRVTVGLTKFSGP